LFIKIVAPGDPDTKSREITLAVLKYIHARMPDLKQMGLAVRVNKIRSQDLTNPRLVAAMRKRGITRLPALTTAANVYLGYKEICDVYERNIKEFAAQNRRGERPVEGAAPEGDLDALWREEMTFERADEDMEESGMNESGGMMDAYRHMMERREQSDAARRGTSRTRGAPAAPASRHAPPPPSPASRPDNVSSDRRQPTKKPPMDAEDAEIQDTIDRLAGDIDDGLVGRAFSSGGGDSYDDDGHADPADDLMERAYFGNRESVDNF
jgi:hypothetical protein